jgi:hypothetical protein
MISVLNFIQMSDDREGFSCLDKLTENSVSWNDVCLQSKKMFQCSSSYMVRLALTDQYCPAVPIIRDTDSNGCRGLVFELPSEYTCNSSSSQTRAYGFIAQGSKDQWHCVEVEENGKLSICRYPEQASSDDMTLGWRVLFQVGAIVEKKLVHRQSGFINLSDVTSCNCS